MADTKITALTAITTVDPAVDVFPIVDVSDTTMAASGTTKKITSNQLLGAGGTATLASATITGDLTVDTSTLKVDSANNRVGIGTASPSYILDILGASPRLHIRDNGTGSSLLDIENGAGTFYVGRENSTGSGGLSGVPYAGILYLQGAYPIICGTNFTERYRIASDGVATWSNVGGVAGTAMTLNATGLGVGVVPSAGKGALQLSSGINFPATQVASSDPNTLDDYEEGVWSPAVSGEVNLTSTTLVSARYTKIGRLVTVSGSVTTFIITSNTLAYFALQNLPFAAAAIGTAGSLWNDTRNTSGSTSVNGSVFYGFLPAASGTTSGSMMTLNFSISYTV